MDDGYYINLNSILISDYERELTAIELIPSRRILQEEIADRFSKLKSHNIRNLQDILSQLSSPQKIKQFAQKSGLSEEYLSILKREIANSQPKPVKLSDYPHISSALMERLNHLGITNSRHLFNFVKTEADRKQLAARTGFAEADILELTKLIDVSRIKWVGANFARLLVDSDWDTTEKIAGANYIDLYQALAKIKIEKNAFQGMFGLIDVKLCVIAAAKVPRAIIY